VSAIPSLRSRRRYTEAIRAYLDVKPYDNIAQQLVAQVMTVAASVKDHPADLINVAIEELVKERYELPAFSTIDRLAKNIRSITNTRLFQVVCAGLSKIEQAYLDGLVLSESQESVATLNLLKSPPKSATLSHMQELQTKFNQLMSFGDAQRLLSCISIGKVKSFAAQAKALDISEFQDIKLPKRRTLLLCLLYQAQVKTRDHLVEMFLKRMQTIHNKAKIKLVELRELHLTQTRDLLGVLAEILSVSNASSDNAALGEQVQSVLTGHGGSQLLLEPTFRTSVFTTST
jgi:hypothetical protein